MSDEYQGRYERHQAKKKKQLMFSEGEKVGTVPYGSVMQPLLFRRSQRIFETKEVTKEHIDGILMLAAFAPSSCNRHGVKIKVVTDRKEKEVASGFMVGGVGWAHRAGVIFLFLADPLAYKSPREKDFQHFCDVGFTAMSMWLTAESLGLGAAYINPNLNKRKSFDRIFGKGKIFCGALAVGHYDDNRRAKRSEHPSIEELLC